MRAKEITRVIAWPVTVLAKKNGSTVTHLFLEGRVALCSEAGPILIDNFF
jgi:hypothetical protein